MIPGSRLSLATCRGKLGGGKTDLEIEFKS